ncbi:MAG: restriction endonuclease subunit S [Rhodobacteraceae bacterium]|nr:restriction endonuclease subunit S [Paracoccaceae bacterium]
MVPEGWRDACLGELVQLQRGHDLPAQERVDGTIPIIGGGGPNGFHNVAKAPSPGIVIGRSGSGIGNAFWCEEPFWPLNTGLYVTDFLGNDPRFCFLWLDWIDFTPHNTGGAQPSLNRNFIYVDCH